MIRLLQSLTTIAVCAAMAFALVFVMKELIVEEFGPQTDTESDGPNPASLFVDCINGQRAPANPTMSGDRNPLNNLRIINQSRGFGVITGGRDVEGRWIAIVDFRDDPPRAYDARSLANPPEWALRRSIASFEVTSAFRSCGSEYLGPVPVPPDQWTAWFEDDFFDIYGQ